MTAAVVWPSLLENLLGGPVPRKKCGEHRAKGDSDDDTVELSVVDVHRQTGAWVHYPPHQHAAPTARWREVHDDDVEHEAEMSVPPTRGGGFPCLFVAGALLAATMLVGMVATVLIGGPLW